MIFYNRDDMGKIVIIKIRKRNSVKLTILICILVLSFQLFVNRTSLIPSGDGDDAISHSSSSFTFHLETEEAKRIKERSRKDLENLKQYCDRFGRRSTTISKFTLEHLVVDTTRRVLYCYVPKVACTSWKRIFAKMTLASLKDTDVMTIDRNTLHAKWYLPLLMNKQFDDTKKQILRTYKKFFFVRNPYTRVLSAYIDKFQNDEPPTQKYLFHKRIGEKIEKRYRNQTTGGHNVTFSEFINYITEPVIQEEEQRNEHWRTIHDICNPCSIKYDFIGRYESLTEDSNYVINWIGATDIMDRFPESDRPFNVKDYDPTYFNNRLNARQRKGFIKLLLEDFVPFNYSMF